MTMRTLHLNTTGLLCPSIFNEYRVIIQTSSTVDSIEKSKWIVLLIGIATRQLSYFYNT